MPHSSDPSCFPAIFWTLLFTGLLSAETAQQQMLMTTSWQQEIPKQTTCWKRSETKLFNITNYCGNIGQCQEFRTRCSFSPPNLPISPQRYMYFPLFLQLWWQEPGKNAATAYWNCWFLLVFCDVSKLLQFSIFGTNRVAIIRDTKVTKYIHFKDHKMLDYCKCSWKQH